MSNGGDRGHSEKKPGPGDLRADTAAGGGDEGEDREQKTGHNTPPDEISVNRIDRLEAENESLRKRAERDVADAKQYAVTQFARDMTRVADNLERALGSLPHEMRKQEGPAKTLIEGVELTGKELLHILEKHGVTRHDPTGQAFDPNFHEAMFETEDKTLPNGTVTMVAEPGYSIGSRPLRPAKVAVSRGGPPRGQG
ncbi:MULTISPECIES: nucleotide exchange factor GrpE [unclassified Agrobacterium]|uniref:nucleotide exchange factor GrpE n=1 Tax=unclassified Agrobacterium TaxID=2632611 RepID=UPI00244B50DB|nr:MULTISPECIES: nucleotide exchange factor GrpE [unclassified Agrobacterium]MDH0616242.1 nucleotide exchange factor GrpE [Agrobacterium sp. GD03872]MDH0698877.1 nucleotide exchange factor GrpE [Agrobacterium sp. GD03871]MDH1060981.1 nucleotide exchange factor GrpE [Agrobacterium sp. GD03992]MDH2211603.1 nucleotide exchange factor GrpE [Agrobacterium sp. GD03643]MDH2221150.1 nucleotide exchange factor GrpE [Agrobacterium sp. GD03638]